MSTDETVDPRVTADPDVLPRPTRRQLLLGAVGVAVTAGAGCSGQEDEETAEQAQELSWGVNDSNYRYISSNGLPDHSVGPFPNPGCPFGLRQVSYQFRVPLRPHRAPNLIPINMWMFGVARNGVPFDPSGPFFKGSNWWQFEVMSPTCRHHLGLDWNHGHVQPNGAYHYHGLCEAMAAGSARAPTSPIALVGFAADGYPIYAQLPPHVTGIDAPPIVPSWRLKQGCRQGGPGGRYDGTMVNDYEFVPGSGQLDRANGWFARTPEFPKGTYCYMLTREFPFIPRFYRGHPDPSFAHPPGTPDVPPALNAYRGPPC